MTKDEMRAEVSRRLAEGTTRVFWTQDDVDDAIDEGYAELSDATEWNEEYVTVDLLNDRPYYDARTVIGADFLAIGPAFNITTNRWLEPSAVRHFDRSDRRWETATGEPQRMYTHGLWWFSYWPRIQSDLGTIKQYYISLPEPFADVSAEPGFPEAFHIGCVHFAMADLWIQDGETQLALAEWALYLDVEARLTEWVNARTNDAMMHGLRA